MFFSDKPVLLEILGEARQRREEERKRQDIFLLFASNSKLIVTGW